MATLDTVVTKTYKLSLTEDEYDWLRKFTAVPLEPSESSSDYKIRVAMWHTLHPVQVKGEL